MSTDLAPIAEPALPADAWETSAAALNEHHAQSRGFNQSTLEQLEAEFLAAGGKIQVIPAGMSGMPYITYNNCPVAKQLPFSSFSRTEQDAHQAAKIKRRCAGDDTAIANIKLHMHAAKTAFDLYRACGFGADKLERLLRDYFQGDELAQSFRKMTRDQREAKVKAEYPALAARLCESECARALHIRHPELKRIIALFGLKPAPAPAPTPAQVWNNPGRPATRVAAEAAAA